MNARLLITKTRPDYIPWVKDPLSSDISQADHCKNVGKKKRKDETCFGQTIYVRQDLVEYRIYGRSSLGMVIARGEQLSS